MTRTGSLGLIVALCALAQACKDGSGPNGPATVTKLTGDNQSATVASAVTTPPAVLVEDANAVPVAGAQVTFAAASGGGSVTGATQTTNASGIATVGGWILGTTVGTNTLTATTGGLTPVIFAATGTAGSAAKIGRASCSERA
jgi:adhesin/invasin